MKKRLPRKFKKAMLTKQRLFDKSLGYKCRRAVMKRFMYQKYLRKLYNVDCNYNEPITLNELQIATKLETMLKKYTDFASV